jgi:predicted site-specific integrase-resolvase
MIERCYSLSRAAETIGVERHTLKRWLLELGLVLPSVRRGSHQMIRESDLERLIEKKGPRTNWALLRSPSKRRNVA